ncbi:MAG: serine hydrolase domain-containing protein, partial [Luminiphilus sp.]
MPSPRVLCFGLVIPLLTLFGCGVSSSLDEAVTSLLEEEVVALKRYPFMTAYVETAKGEVLVSSAVVNPDFYKYADGPGVDDWMRIWSMSKLVTIVLALDLAEDGVFSLEDEAANYLAELAALKVARPLSGGTLSEASAQSYELNATEDRGQSACDFSLESPSRAMTIRDLMVHTAGFYYATTNLPCLDEAQAALELPLAKSSDEWMQSISTLPLIQSPDEGYYYGLNTTVLGFVMERATGKSL